MGVGVLVEPPEPSAKVAKNGGLVPKRRAVASKKCGGGLQPAQEPNVADCTRGGRHTQAANQSTKMEGLFENAGTATARKKRRLICCMIVGASAVGLARKTSRALKSIQSQAKRSLVYLARGGRESGGREDARAKDQTTLKNA